MHKLTKISDKEYLTNTIKKFEPTQLTENDVECITQFAYDMAFGKKAKNHANGIHGYDSRSQIEIFSNEFQGKAGEFGVANKIYDAGLDISMPDLNVYDDYVGDNGDLFLGNDCISVKSSSSFVNLFRLNKYDCRDNGSHLEDYMVFSRVMNKNMSTVRSTVLKIDELIKKDSLSASEIEKLMCEECWVYDVTGFVRRDTFINEIMANDFSLNKGDVVDRFVKSFYDSYYVQTGDMADVEYLSLDEIDYSNDNDDIIDDEDELEI